MVGGYSPSQPTASRERAQAPEIEAPPQLRVCAVARQAPGGRDGRQASGRRTVPRPSAWSLCRHVCLCRKFADPACLLPSYAHDLAFLSGGHVSDSWSGNAR